MLMFFRFDTIPKKGYFYPKTYFHLCFQKKPMSQLLYIGLSDISNQLQCRYYLKNTVHY